MQELMLIAASGLAREVLSIIRGSDQYRVVGFLDDSSVIQGRLVGGVNVLGTIAEAALYNYPQFLICVGSGTGRQQIAERLAHQGITRERFATVLDPGVRVPPGCTVGYGSILLSNVVLTADVTLGAHVVAMPQVTLTHDDAVEDFATLCAGVTLGGGVRIGRAAYLGMNSSIRQGLAIGAEAVIGMGASVLQDVPAGETWAGVPAKKLYDGLQLVSGDPAEGREA
ncbi:acetyltransferase [Arthrobacter sp. MI7-26]|uniref:acetyltransferase n=1 Tax=Arthrobacter sp. MI7-26 TaxID=2993653 RepID=UPI002248FC49|nr:acetyltransferase [Arthrobacter sp. MI7-26]MCX2750269.1 acetyltransferase [Arthrobacter sp. MI7-26]